MILNTSMTCSYSACISGWIKLVTILSFIHGAVKQSRGPYNDHSCQVLSKSSQSSRRCPLKQLLTMHDWHPMIIIAHYELMAQVRWAKKDRLISFPLILWVQQMFLNSNTFLFLFSNKMFVIKAGIHKMFFRIANRENQDQTASSEAVWSWSALFV